MEQPGLVVLLVEDAESDAQIFALAVEETHLNILLQRVTDGGAAVEYLSGKGIYGQRRDFPLPDVVVLDLFLPTSSGTDFLAWCRRSELCQHLPCILLTGTVEHDRELQRALRQGANRAYIKPSSIHDLENIVREIYQTTMDYKLGQGAGPFSKQQGHLA